MLLRSLASQVTYRIINTAIVMLRLLYISKDYRVTLLPLATSLMAVVVAVLWSSEQTRSNEAFTLLRKEDWKIGANDVR